MTFKKFRRKFRRKFGYLLNIPHDIKWWVIYRTTQRYHIVNTGLSPRYYENDERMLYASFSLLVEFIEVELGYYMAPEAQNRRLGRFKPSRELGEAWINQRLNDTFIDPFWDSSKEKEAYREIYDLYLWWKDIRPKRPDAHDITGYVEFYRELSKKHGSLFRFEPDLQRNITELENKKFTELSELSYKIIAEYDKEDTRMFQRLLKIRSWLSL